MTALLRYWTPRAVFVVAVVTQLYFIARGYRDPHKHFAFQPFNEADRFRFEVFRIDRRGQRHSVSQPWSGYRWASLVRGRGLDRPGRWQPASSGIESTLVFLREALAWVATHTPEDTHTIRYEAKVSYYNNQRGPFARILAEPRLLPSSRVRGKSASREER